MSPQSLQSPKVGVYSYVGSHNVGHVTTNNGLYLHNKIKFFCPTSALNRAKQVASEHNLALSL